jgi:hypothetical protein
MRCSTRWRARPARRSSLSGARPFLPGPREMGRPCRRRPAIWNSLDFRRIPLELALLTFISRLAFLGFPWILSSETGLFNGLRPICGKKFFRRPSHLLNQRRSVKSRERAPFRWRGRFRSGVLMKPIVTGFLFFSKSSAREIDPESRNAAYGIQSLGWGRHPQPRPCVCMRNRQLRGP